MIQWERKKNKKRKGHRRLLTNYKCIENLWLCMSLHSTKLLAERSICKNSVFTVGKSSEQAAAAASE